MNSETLAVKVLGKEKPQIITKMQGDAEIIKASGGDTFSISSANVQHKRTVIAQFTVNKLGKFA